MSKTAKLFNTGGSQAVRLPAEFRFEEDQVFIRRDDRTGDVILSRQPRSQWRDFMELRAQFGPPPGDFLADRLQPMQDRDPFKDWHE